MKILCGVLFFALCLLANACHAVVKTDSCVECHQQLDDSPQGPAALFKEDVHFQRGLSCADCHGGDPYATEQEKAMDAAKGYVGTPKRRDIPQFCARCHADPNIMRKYNPNLPTDQYAKYLTSQHGKKNSAGDKDVAVCTSCHQAHGIRSKKDPLSPVFASNIPNTCAFCHNDTAIMSKHGLPVTQFAEYSKGVHGQALLFRGDRGAPHCASCHGSHEASKPGVISIGNVCAQCHGLTRDLFAQSPHKAAHDAMGLPECEVCHGNHRIEKPTDDMLGTGPQAVCSGCHTQETKGFATASLMRGHIEAMKAQIAHAKARNAEAAQLGMDTGEAEYDLHEAEAKLTQARTYVHTFSADRVQPIAEEGIAMARQAKEKADKAVGEFYYRRKGLWITLAFIALLIAALVLKIRDIERRNKSQE